MRTGKPNARNGHDIPVENTLRSATAGKVGRKPRLPRFLPMGLRVGLF